MRRLILLRHAKTERDAPSGKDHDRRLEDRGRSDAAPGTLVTQDANTIQIEAEALSIPESLTVSVEGVEAGTQILAGQVELPKGVTLVTDAETLVVNVVTAPTAEDLDAEGAGEEEAASGEEAAAEGEAAEEAAAESE